jgi:triphosphoribosyl-dephospho-CoA synthase
MSRREPAVRRALEVLVLDTAVGPKPGAVDRYHDHPDVRADQFVAGAVGALDGLTAAADDGPLGEAFYSAVAGMADAAGTNTHFGTLLLLVPLVRAAADDNLDPDGLASVIGATTVADAVVFLEALQIVDVRLAPIDAGDRALDATDPERAIATVERDGLTWSELLAASPTDANAAIWQSGFTPVFETADRFARGLPLGPQIPAVFTETLQTHRDSHIIAAHGEGTARWVQHLAKHARSRWHLDAQLRTRAISPGATADHVTAAVFIERMRRGGHTDGT